MRDGGWVYFNADKSPAINACREMEQSAIACYQYSPEERVFKEKGGKILDW